MKNDHKELLQYNPEGSDLRKAQKIMLNILCEVAKICNRHKISYWLSAGTLLGAVRHNGFIPWDDDIDIEVEQKDFKRLIRILQNELPSNLLVQSEFNDVNYFHKFAKVRNINTLIHEEGSTQFENRGIFIDIFPRESSNLFFVKIYHLIMGNSFYKSRFKESKMSLSSNFLINNSRILIANSILVVNRLLNKVFKFKESYALSFVKYYVGLNREQLYPLKNVIFEGESFNSPSDHDAYLKSYFGDYMTIPTPDKRIVHSTKIEFFENIN